MWKLIIFVILLVVTARTSIVIGAGFWVVICFSTQLPKIGSAIASVISGPVKMTLVIKAAAYAISASGPLLGYWLYSMVWGIPSQSRFYWLMLLVSSAVVLNTTHDILLFKDIASYPATIPKAEQLTRRFGMKGMFGKPEINKSLSRALFVDMYLPQFFRVLMSLGMAYFAMGHLSLLNVEGNRVAPTLFDCLRVAFSLIGAGEPRVTFSGQRWDILRLFSFFIVFFWIVMFVALASTMIQENTDSHALDTADASASDSVHAVIIGSHVPGGAGSTGGSAAAGVPKP